MKNHINPIRAIGAEFLKRKYQAIALLFSIIFVVLSVITALLIAKVSMWFWLLAGFVFIGFLLGAIALLVFRILLGSLKPHMTKEQKRAVASFVDKFERITETIGTPWFMVAFYVIKDVIRPNGSSTYIASKAHDGTTLHKDYLAVVKMFS